MEFAPTVRDNVHRRGSIGISICEGLLEDQPEIKTRE
jgi:hypothetical protein